MKKLTFAICLTAALSAPAIAQTCKTDSIAPTQKAGQFLDNEDGTVTDIVNGLVWSKCSLGQTFADNSCTGSPTHIHSWQEALTITENNKDYLGTTGWRLPNIKELSSLVERSCTAPSINLEAFPSTPLGVYWSNTFDAKGTNSASGIKALIVDFTDGSEFLKDVNTHRLVRLVKQL
ncbi:DUF1566 domain-containing protein [Pseudoalteromonas sp. SR45-4]|uniref:Lcl C-terminal domain-containing protein n=1 Tax=Pseudoalteromonas sp. SR45-4 TaxID=2760929 RepID=UPI0015FD7075|nr:DUF1566 domain-containing protein [Pseudoalteromonas sp. SR45-4]MBB1371983.1 DUF1566 domain-containing protein [Pseudoalteromonas sp. SR45-4]